MNIRILSAVAALALLLSACSAGPAPSASLQQGEISASQPPQEESLPSDSSEPASASSASSAQESSEPPEPELPAVEISIDASSAKQGGILILRAENLPQGAAVSASTTLDFTPSFFAVGEGTAAAIMPVKSGTAPGEYSIVVTAAQTEKRFTVTVSDAGFNVEHIEMEQSVADSTVGNTAAADEFEEVTRPLKNSADPEVYWKDSFRLPIRQEKLTVSSDFGDTRYINNVFNGRHGGIDFPAPAGTPVTAANRGRVLYAGFLQLTGNTVCIEHGMGLKSWYYHMSALSVETGDMAESGQKIGEVGTTGASTGNHLHFAFTVYGVFVDPWTILENGVDIS